MTGRALRLMGTVGLASLMGVVVVGAVIDEKQMAAAEGRRRTAETGVKAIKSKQAASLDQARTAYTTAMTDQNAWLDLTVRAVKEGPATAPDAARLAETAASSLLAWATVRVGLLGEGSISPAAAESTKSAIVRNLTALTQAAWQENLKRNESARAAAVKTLDDRLRWKAFDEIR